MREEDTDSECSTAVGDAALDEVFDDFESEWHWAEVRLLRVPFSALRCILSRLCISAAALALCCCIDVSRLCRIFCWRFCADCLHLCLLCCFCVPSTSLRCTVSLSQDGSIVAENFWQAAAGDETFYRWWCPKKAAWGIWADSGMTGDWRWVVSPGEEMYAWYSRESGRWGIWLHDPATEGARWLGDA